MFFVFQKQIDQPLENILGIGLEVFFQNAALALAVYQHRHGHQIGAPVADGHGGGIGAVAVGFVSRFDAVAAADTADDGVDYNVVPATAIASKVTYKEEEKNADLCVMPITAASKLLGSGEKYQMLGAVTHGNLYLIAKDGDEVSLYLELAVRFSLCSGFCCMSAEDNRKCTHRMVDIAAGMWYTEKEKNEGGSL